LGNRHPSRRALLAGFAALAGAGVATLASIGPLQDIMPIGRFRFGSEPPQPPVVPKRPHVIRRHGIEIVDDYAWLKDPDWRDVLASRTKLDAEILAHLKAENAYARHVLSASDAIRRKIVRESASLAYESGEMLPERDGPWLYFTRSDDDAVYEQLCRAPADGSGPEQVMLDGDVEAGDADYWDLGDAMHSPDHALLAYAVDHSGAERYTLRIRDLATGRDLPEIIPDTSSDLVWASDSRSLFYVRIDAENRPLEVWRHTVGTPVGRDVLVFREADPTFDVILTRSRSGAYIFISSEDHTSSEVFFIAAATPEVSPRRVAGRTPGHFYMVEHRGDGFVVLTNSGQSPDNRVCLAPIAEDTTADWVEIVPHQAGRRLTEIVVLERFLVLLAASEGVPHLLIKPWAGGAERVFQLDDGPHHLEIDAGYQFDRGTVELTYSSLVLPERVFEIDLATHARTLRQTSHTRRGYDPANYVVERVFAPAPDGVAVPVTLLYRKDRPRDGFGPAMLHGYGAYGDAVDVDFSAERIALVDRGFLFAIVHVRGGIEMGARWHAGGRLEAKPNSFRDFVAAGEHLVALGLTGRGRIVAHGESAGGMLVTAAANLAPDLFLGVIAEEPFVDVLSTLLDRDLPMTPGEWPEFGNPIERKDQFELIASYCPYVNIAPQAYPAFLVTAGIADQRVTYWEPAKFVARLRERSTSGRPVLLWTNMSGGHSGSSSSSDRSEEIARAYAFAVWLAETSPDGFTALAPTKGKKGGRHVG